MKHVTLGAVCLIFGASFSVVAQDALAEESADEAAGAMEPEVLDVGPSDTVMALVLALNGEPVEVGGVGPGLVTARLEASGDAIVLRENLDHARPGTNFSSETERVARFYLEDIDPESVAVRLDPPSVFAKTHDNEKRIAVIRSETKTRRSGDLVDEWLEDDRFVTSFVSIPVVDARAGESVAEAFRAAAREAQGEKKRRRHRN